MSQFFASGGQSIGVSASASARIHADNNSRYGLSVCVCVCVCVGVNQDTLEDDTLGKLLNTMANTTSLSNLIRSWKRSSRKSLAGPVTVEKNLALDGRKEHVWSGMGSAGLWACGVCEVKLRVGGGCPVSGGGGSLS